MNAAPKRSKPGLPELVLRAISGIALIILALFVTWLGGAAFALICAAGAVLMLVEYLQIVRSNVSPGIRLAATALLAIALAAWFAFAPSLALIVAAVAVFVLAGWEFAGRRSLWSAVGLAYAFAPFCALVLLRGAGETGLHIVLLLFACVWGTDTAAYFAGRSLGGPKLAPKISPKKTWSGALGGVAGAAAISGAVLLLAGYRLSPAALALVIALSVVSQLGDLSESWIKRRFHVKDSGSIIPGHGGVLDRVDGLVLASVAAWLAGGLLGGALLEPESAGKALFAAFVLP